MQSTNPDQIPWLAQILSGVAQPIFQVLIPGYSEKWFNLRQRTTATMLMSICASLLRTVPELLIFNWLALEQRTQSVSR